MKKLLLICMNNVVTNRILILLKKDGWIKKYINDWSRTKLDKTKSLQENVGFSHEDEVQKAINQVHEKVQATFLTYCQSSADVLDIGCGVGLYLQDFPSTTRLSGTDLSTEFIQKGKELLPEADLRVGDFMQIHFDKPFQMIFSISVLEYIPPSQLQTFFKKIYHSLDQNGVVLIQYPHALSNKMCWYPDLSYVHYSPLKVAATVEKVGFEICEHIHSYDQRELNFKFDKNRYDPEKEKSFRNGAIIIAKKN